MVQSVFRPLTLSPCTRLKDVLEAEPQNGNALFALGVVQHNLGDIAGARTHFEETVELNSSHTNALYNLGFVHMEETNYTAAKTTLQKLLDLKPDHYMAIVQLASCYVNTGELEKGLGLYEEVLEASKEDNAIALALTNLGEFTLRESTVLSTNGSVLAMHAGAVKTQLGHLEEAVELLSRAVTMDPANQVAVKNLSKAQQQLLHSQNATHNHNINNTH